MNDVIELHVAVHVENDPHGHNTERAMQNLADELRQVRRFAINRRELPSNAGSKGTGLLLPEILVSFGAAGAVLPTLVSAIRDWLLRQPRGTTLRIKRGDVEFELSGQDMDEKMAELIRRLFPRNG
ncbi:effector-associated constant component EACC1 [Novosphingobium sp. KACC 22771]|uniref:effector-associated constant component EACC1 n=1 Tax=Novosphingobium sp. KACC 22771 TaxID=3025670 RepID=UPI0023653B27|nr:hypothetical protein [Novosphingobium sp. KACC 22771]WDF70959.1 hypothetical protein PQ467_08870 [Novosphingobium sp. KACC 22771]